MTTETSSPLMLIGLVLALFGGGGALMSFGVGHDIGAGKYLMVPIALIGIGMMMAAKFTPVQQD